MDKYTGFPAQRAGFTARRGVSVVMLFCSVLAFSIQAVGAAAPVGVKLLVQPWNPLTDDDSVQTVYDSKDAITASLNKTWDKVKPKLIDTIRARLQTPNLFAKGVSLYDTKINVNAPELSITPDGNAGFIAKLLVHDSYLEATSTTPDIAFGIGLGSYADPRCSIRFSLELTLRLAVTDDKSRLLEARYAPNDKPVVVKGFKADSQNAVCDIAKFLASDVAKLFTGRDLWQWMTDEINNPQRPEYTALNNAIKQELNAALVSINAQARVPAQYARLRVWTTANKLTVLFGVRELPLPARTASVRGRLAIGDLKGLPLEISNCDQIQMTARVKTGPAPLLNASGTEFGKPPMVAVGKLRGSALAAPVAGQTCDYTAEQLVPGFPNLLEFHYGNKPYTPVAVGNGARPRVEYVLNVRPEGWHYTKALHPQPLLTGLNLTLQADTRTNVSLNQERRRFDKEIPRLNDPLVNPGRPLESGVLNPRLENRASLNQGKATTPANALGTVGAKSPLSAATPALSAPSALSAGGAARPKTQMQTPVTSQIPLKKAGPAALSPQPSAAPVN